MNRSVLLPLIVGSALLGLAYLFFKSPGLKEQSQSLAMLRRPTVGHGIGVVPETVEERTTTIDSLLAFRRPPGSLPDRRIRPVETTVWTVEATIQEISVRADGDYYLVIQSSTGKRTVAEVPTPEKCKGCPYLSQIEVVRRTLARAFSPNGEAKPLHRRALLTGLGFYGQPSASSNGVRIQPVLKIRLL